MVVLASIYTSRTSIHLYTISTLQTQFRNSSLFFQCISVHRVSPLVNKPSGFSIIYRYRFPSFQSFFDFIFFRVCFVHSVFHLPFHLEEEKKKKSRRSNEVNAMKFTRIKRLVREVLLEEQKKKHDTHTQSEKKKKRKKNITHYQQNYVF